MNREEREREDRMLGVNGKVPTLRDKWKAFHRLWRLAHRKVDDWSEHAVKECFWTLFPRSRWASFLASEANDGLVDRSHIPLFLRRRLLDDARRRRLYSGQYELRDRDAAVSVEMANRHGIEMTPEQVAETRFEVCRKLRDAARRDGYELPSRDADLLALLRKGTIAKAEGGTP